MLMTSLQDILLRKLHQSFIHNSIIKEDNEEYIQSWDLPFSQDVDRVLGCFSCARYVWESYPSCGGQGKVDKGVWKCLLL